MSYFATKQSHQSSPIAMIQSGSMASEYIASRLVASHG